MTRINIIPPKELTDQHLIAEIHEINQLSGSYTRSLNSKNGIKSIPSKFTLNTGHVTYFYNKGMYLHNRFNELKTEAINRGFNIQANFQNAWQNTPENYNDWTPDEDAFKIIKERITNKINYKPNFYRYYGTKICISNI